MIAYYQNEKWEIISEYRESHLIELRDSVPDYTITLRNTATGKTIRTTLSQIKFSYEW